MIRASIVIRTLNEEKYLKDLLDGIVTQDYKDWEIIVVDSGSTDATLKIAEDYGVKIVKIKSRDFTFGHSLNVGCEASIGDFLVFVSAHVRPVNNQWLGNLLAPFEDEKIAMVYGRQMGGDSSKFSERMDFRRIFGTTIIESDVTKYYANNANSAIRKSFWNQKGFDEYLFGLEDIEWARTYAADGYVIHYEPTAGIYHIHEERWSQVFNRYRREAIAAVRIKLTEPPQVKLNVAWVILRTLHDLINSFPNYTRNRVEEILRFRYYQWKGSRLGWIQGKKMNFERDRQDFFYPSNNQGVVIKGVERALFTDVALPHMHPGDILIKVDYVGVCRTDIEVYDGTLGYYRDGVAEYPIVPGHEFSGTIAKIGSNNKFQERFKVGQRVVGECILSRGEHAKREEVGVINHDGAYSQYVVAPGDSVHKIPENVDSKTAVLTEPLAVVLRALRRIEERLRSGVKIAVIGGGQIGNLSAQVLALRGYDVTIFDRDKNRLNLISSENIKKNIDLRSIEDFQIVIEATGSRQALEVAIRQSNVDATILLLGFPYGDMTYNFEDVVGKEKMIIGSVGADGVDFDEALRLLPSLDMQHFTENIMPLKNFKDAWNTHKSSKYLKILLQP